MLKFTLRTIAYVKITVFREVMETTEVEIIRICQVESATTMTEDSMTKGISITEATLMSVTMYSQYAVSKTL